MEERTEELNVGHSEVGEDYPALSSWNFSLSLFSKMPRGEVESARFWMSWPTLRGTNLPFSLGFTSNKNLCIIRFHDVISSSERERVPLDVDDIKRYVWDNIFHLVSVWFFSPIFRSLPFIYASHVVSFFGAHRWEVFPGWPFGWPCLCPSICICRGDSTMRNGGGPREDPCRLGGSSRWLSGIWQVSDGCSWVHEYIYHCFFNS